ncbi:MAG: 50S ribosomal protein L15 [Rhizobiales bacterium]|nr:50S ribosomal protein L15 [Hyphomicrobiales bacterium]
MKLNQLADRPGARRHRTRIGRGIGSGKGKTGGRGGKGQTARSGVRIKGFEGGQMPLHRRLPKRGFRNVKFARRLNEINLGSVQSAIDAGRLDAKNPVDVGAMVKAGLMSRAKDGVRLLGGGAIKSKVEFSVWGASKTAIAAVEKLGGSVKVLAPKKEAPKEPRGKNKRIALGLLKPKTEPAEAKGEGKGDGKGDGKGEPKPKTDKPKGEKPKAENPQGKIAE